MQQARFCCLIAQGHSQHDAFAEAFPKSRAKGESVDTMASRLMGRVEIRSRIRELLKESKATDMDSQGEVYRDLCTALAKAEQAGNWTAYASLMRLRMHHLGMLQQHVSVSSYSAISDENLVERVSGGDPATAKVLWRILGAASFADAAALEGRVSLDERPTLPSP